jgi:hypothetical protein
MAHSLQVHAAQCSTHAACSHILPAKHLSSQPPTAPSRQPLRSPAPACSAPTLGLWLEGLRSFSSRHCAYSSFASSLHEAARARGRGSEQSRSGGGRPLVCRMTQLMSSTMACRQ